MIKYNLKCKNKHEFEGWFSDSKEFEKLKAKRLIECSYCKNTSVQKSIMSPSILNKDQTMKDINFSKKYKKVRENLYKIKNFIEKNFEYVGEDFPREVRNVYYDNRKNKNIYGKATHEETKELKDEGIELTTIPWPDNKRNN